MKPRIATIPTRLASSNGPEKFANWLLCASVAMIVNPAFWHYGATVTAGARIEGIKSLSRPRPVLLSTSVPE